MKKLSSLLLVLVMIFSLCGCEQETIGITENTSAVVEEKTTSPVVYRTETGEKYHRDSCIHLKSKIETTVDEAWSMGLKPCSVCQPPQ